MQSKHPSHLRSVAFIVLFAFLASACPAAIPAGTCQSHADCNNDEVCVQNICHKTCNYNRDCAADEYCLDGACALRPDDAGIHDAMALDHADLPDASTSDHERTDINTTDSSIVDVNASADSLLADGFIADSNSSDSSIVDVNTAPDSLDMDASILDSSSPDTISPDTAVQPDTYIDPCGNGIIDDGESCDDGNKLEGDGCLADCTLQDGWHCDNSTGRSFCCKNGDQDNDLNGVCSVACAYDQAPDCLHGDCDDSTGTALCVCDDFYEGDSCESCRVFVSGSGSDEANGDSWDHSLAHLQSGIALAQSLMSTSTQRCQVRLAQGDYTPGDVDGETRFTLAEGIDLVGGYAGPNISGLDPNLQDPDLYSSRLYGEPDGHKLIAAASNSSISGCLINGGGIRADAVLNFAVDDCRFIHNKNNSSIIGGGALSIINNAGISISNSHFINNVTSGRGGAIQVLNGGHADISDCLFVGNSAYDYGGALIAGSNSQVKVKRCIFASNSVDGGGGAISVNGGGTLQVESSLFIGNEAKINQFPPYHGRGGGVRYFAGTGSIIGSTFVFQKARYEIAISTTPDTNPDLLLRNNIVYANDNNDNAVDLENVDSDYSLIEGGYPGPSNIDSDPRFIPAILTELGRDDPVYDAISGTTTITILVTTELEQSGQYFVSPGPTLTVYGPHYYPVLSINNEQQSTTITVAGDATGDFNSGHELQLHRFDLQSNSPCIDSGDPTYDQPDIEGNARVCMGINNNNCVDMGAFEYQPGSSD